MPRTGGTGKAPACVLASTAAMGPPPPAADMPDMDGVVLLTPARRDGPVADTPLGCAAWPSAPGEDGPAAAPGPDAGGARLGVGGSEPVGSSPGSVAVADITW